MHEFRSPYHPGIVESIDGNTGEPVESGKGASNEAYVQEPALPPGVIGAIVANPRDGRAVFKVLDLALAAGEFQSKKRKASGASGALPGRLPDGGRGSGCVCHQSSVLTSDRLRQIITDATPASAGPLAVISLKDKDKRILCEAYELVLRRHRPQAILRVGWRFGRTRK